MIILHKRQKSRKQFFMLEKHLLYPHKVVVIDPQPSSLQKKLHAYGTCHQAQKLGICLLIKKSPSDMYAKSRIKLTYQSYYPQFCFYSCQILVFFIMNTSTLLISSCNPLYFKVR